MTQQNSATLKNYFLTGDKPTQTQFANLIDSYYNLSDHAADGWKSLVVPYTDMQIAALTKTVAFITLAQKQVIKTLMYHITTTFAAPSMTTLTFRLWDNVPSNALTAAISMTAVGGNAQTFFNNTWSGPVMDVVNPYSLKLQFIIAGAASLNALTAGSMTLFYELVTLP